MHACRRVYLDRVAEFDRRRGWKPGGHRSCADWLAFHTGCDMNTAREHVRVARALTRVATPEEEDLLALAEGVLRGEEGGVLDVGRKRRTVPPALRRALEVRDRGCRFPGCGLRFTDAHHIEHWSDGGETSLENCVLLCRRHHRFVHEENWSVEWWGENRVVFRDPKGGVHLEERPAPPENPDDPAPA